MLFLISFFFPDLNLSKFCPFSIWPTTLNKGFSFSLYFLESLTAYWFMYSSRTLAMSSSSSFSDFSFCIFFSCFSFSFIRSSFLIETLLSDLLLPDLCDAKAPKLSSRRSLLFDLICMRPLLRALYLSSYLYMLTRLALRCRPALRVDERRYLPDSYYSLF